MNCNGSKFQSCVRPLVLAVATSMLLAVGMVNPACAAKPLKPPSTPLDTGTIYYTAMGGTYGIWSMKPDGSAKTSLQTWPSPYATEPSQARHNGSRWFLTLLDPSGTGTSYGVFAVNEDGSIVVQVTTLPDLVQPHIPNGSRDRAQLRWATRSDQASGFIPDGRVSFLGLDGTAGELGIYAADIDPDALGLTGFQPTVSTRVREDLNLLPPVGDYADFDWSPDGDSIVFVVTGTGEPDGIYVTGLEVGSVPFRVAPPGCVRPRWSPFRSDGTSRIAFFTGSGSLIELDSVNPDGTNPETVIPPLSRNYFGANVRWSPHGTCLIYDVLQISRDQRIERFIYRVTADGGSPTCLTKTLTSAFPLGWAAEP